ncbi:MAG: prephenate dehydratase [Gammaproteobacteria bacterium]|nr:prephenate dehydratase [Gammaproteobacteria bacterium]
MSDEGKLKAIRARIDAIDAQLQQLITERAECAQQVAHNKVISDSAEYYRPEREAEVLRTVKGRNHGPLSDDAVVQVFREIMSACLALQQPMQVAYLGPEGTYTHAATLKHFGHAAQTRPLPTIDQVFREVESGNTHYGVVPVENSTEGVVNHTLDMFLSSPLLICSEIELRIHHHLLATSAQRGTLTRIYAHQQTLAQCRGWLDSHLPGIERIAVSSNGEAARLAAQQPGSAAIAGDMAAEIYGLQRIASNIEDEPDNTTRFLVIGRKMAAASGQDKTSLLLAAPNRPGALFALLQPFSRQGITLTRIESRPSRRAVWEYVFFVDVEGHVQEPAVAGALRELEQQASMVKVLGSYPRAVV